MSALRLALAAIHDLEISARAEGRSVRPDEGAYDSAQNGAPSAKNLRPPSVRASAKSSPAKKENEIAVLRDFLPQELNETELGKVLDELIRETGATSLRDLGSVMAGLKGAIRGAG